MRPDPISLAIDYAIVLSLNISLNLRWNFEMKSDICQENTTNEI